MITWSTSASWRFPGASRVAVTLIVLASGVASQCATTLGPGNGIAGVNGTVLAVVPWDPDGSGPSPIVLLVGGSFTMAGAVAARNIAVVDPVSGVWSALGAGMDATVRTIVVLPNGDACVGGDFVMAGGFFANRVASWSAGAWLPLGFGVNGRVNALTVQANGDLVAGGEFTVAGSVNASRVARWNGSGWSAMGSGATGSVYTLCSLPSGDVLAGGTGFVMTWNGTSWSGLGPPLVGGELYASAVMPNGDIVVGGTSLVWPTVSCHLARWNGTAWSQLAPNPAGAPPLVYSLAVTSTGALVVGGSFGLVGSLPASDVAVWNGTAWSSLNYGVSSPAAHSVNAVAAWPTGEVIVGGNFLTAGGSGALGIARWTGSSWSSVGSGIDGSIAALAASPTGGVIVAGDFRSTPGGPANHIAHWDGPNWTPMGWVDAPVKAVTTRSNGEIIAGGDFVNVYTSGGNAAANHIARWDGAAWATMGTGLNASVSGLAALPNGDVVVCGPFTMAGTVPVQGVARWNGTSWSSMGGVPFTRLAASANGELYAIREYYTAVARWTGSAWAVIGVANWPLYSIEALSNGDVVVGGNFTTINGIPAMGIARWSGGSWSSMGPGLAIAPATLAELPGGDIVAGGADASLAPWRGYLKRWNGSTWTDLAALNDTVMVSKFLPQGDLVITGSFTSSASAGVQVKIARLTTSCPPVAASYGAGCSGPGGALSLAADSLPWNRTTFRLRASGSAAGSLGLVVLSLGQLTPGVPLQSLPVPGPGAACTWDVASFDIVLAATPAGPGEKTAALPLSLTTVLPGSTFHAQFAELDLSAGWIGTYSSNALSCTIGSF